MTVRADDAEEAAPEIAPYDLVGLPPPTLRRADVAERTGVPSEQSLRWWRAMGFAEVDDDELAFRDADVDMVRALQALIDGGLIGDADVSRLARLMGASFSRLVDAQLDAIGTPLSSISASAFDGGAPEVFAFMESSMSYVWRRHLLAAIQQRFWNERTDISQAVGFVDLSGFSKVSQTLSGAELADLIETFETVAFDVVSGLGGRVVKLIGDEVMFVTATIDDAVEIALELIRRLGRVATMPPVHCGLAAGPTLTIGGDVFGPTVNLASRLTKVARRGSVAVPRDVGEHFLERDDLDVRRVRRHYDLKGIGRTSVIVIRDADAGTGSRRAATADTVGVADVDAETETHTGNGAVASDV